MGGVVEVLTVWDVPDFHGGRAWLPPTDSELAVLEAEADQNLTRAVQAVAGPRSVVEVRAEARRGTPAGVLLQAANDAALLVVGSRGRGGFAGLLLGSVARYCVQYAPCPVLVARGDFQ